MEKNCKKLKNKRCERCGKKADIFLPYGPHYFCKEHFIYFFEKRVRRTIRKFNLIKPKEKLLVAMSGGKDSSVAAYLVAKIFANTNEINALLIDEGIKFRRKALEIAEKNCSEWGINVIRKNFAKEFGFKLDELNPREFHLESFCSLCSVLKRRLMNSVAKEIKAKKIITGHNLDDEVQSIVMNVFDNDIARFVRLGATSGIRKIPGFVPRVKPLYETPEVDIVGFAKFAKIKYYAKQCPYKGGAKRIFFKEKLNEFEEKYPGTKFSILRFYLSIKEKIEIGNFKINYCKICGEPSSKQICMACKKLNALKKKTTNL